LNQDMHAPRKSIVRLAHTPNGPSGQRRRIGSTVIGAAPVGAAPPGGAVAANGTTAYVTNLSGASVPVVSGAMFPATVATIKTSPRRKPLRWRPRGRALCQHRPGAFGDQYGNQSRYKNHRPARRASRSVDLQCSTSPLPSIGALAVRRGSVAHGDFAYFLAFP
jgi:hypothetical protein